MGGIVAALLLGGSLALVTRSDIAAKSAAGDNSVSADASGDSAATALSGNESLDTFLTFTSAKTCDAGGDLAEALRLLAAARGADSGTDETIRLHGLDAVLQPAVAQLRPKADGRVVTVAEISLRGQWRGLHITALRTASWEGSPLNSFQIRFSEPVSSAQPALKQLGFPIPKPGELRAVKGLDSGGSAIGLEPTGGGSALTCVHGLVSPPDIKATDDSPSDSGT